MQQKDPEGSVLQSLHDRQPEECQKLQTKQQFQFSSMVGTQTEPLEVGWLWPGNGEVDEPLIAPVASTIPSDWKLASAGMNPCFFSTSVMDVFLKEPGK